MHLTTCPVCHSTIDLLSLVEDKASSELLGEVATLESWLAPNVLLYIGLFKPAKSLLVILFNYQAIGVHEAELVLSLGVPLFR